MKSLCKSADFLLSCFQIDGLVHFLFFTKLYDLVLQSPHGLGTLILCLIACCKVRDNRFTGPIFWRKS
uniref:Uncharacterized protein n=1 Tax=Rhizophora mucronata TaxID=61149 RepID=A0A2P2QDY6_RHIMU